FGTASCRPEKLLVESLIYKKVRSSQLGNIGVRKMPFEKLSIFSCIMHSQPSITLSVLNKYIAMCKLAAKFAHKIQSHQFTVYPYTSIPYMLTLRHLNNQSRPNLSNVVFPTDLREQLQRKLGELESQLMNKVLELEDDKFTLQNESASHRFRTESALNALHERVTELEKGTNAFKSPDDFKVSLPLQTNYLYAKIKKSIPEMYGFTICLWIRSRGSSGIGTPFSYAVPGQANEIVLIEWGNNPIELLINDKVAQLPMTINDDKWHHICVTWSTRDGIWEAYQDGELRGSGENLAPWHPIKQGGILILGQEQDTIGGRFDATQAFVGELSHFNIWDRILSSEDIMSIANCSANLAGNIIPWVDNNIDVFGGAKKTPVQTCWAK
uniref:Neuronal pentraxin IIb n=1 Tax=Callorhinchus milii TaxID=7868 RepID=A0A4W3HSG3_CALMI